MKRATRIPELDLLRLIAALGVMGFHYVSSYIPTESRGPILSAISHVSDYGYLGVNLFFIISGFVITWSAKGRTPSGFAISRISRLYPSFWSAMLLTAAFIVLLGPYATGVPTPAVNTETLAANATMMPHLFGSPRIDDVYWTLEFEIRFYLLVFAILSFGQMKSLENCVYIWLAGCLVSFWYPLPWILTYLTLMPYGPLFIAGCLFSIVFSRGWTIARGVTLALTAILCAAHSITQRSEFIEPDPISAWVAPGVVLLFFAIFLVVIRIKGDRLTSPVVYRLGALTYPLYLTHAVIGALSIDFLAIRVGTTTALLVTTVLALFLAQALVMAVDEPARKPMARFCQSILDKTTNSVAALGNRLR